MAIIKKCDRCGKVYGKNEMPVMYWVVNGDGEMDLCDACAQDLVNFIEMRIDPINCGAKYSR